MPTPSDIRQAILTATINSRKLMNVLDKSAAGELLGVYREAAEELRKRIEGQFRADSPIEISDMRGLLAQITDRIGALSAARDALLEGSLIDAATLGAKAIGLDANSIVRLANEAVQFVRSFVAADGLALSDRVWRLDQGATKVVGQAVQSAILQGQSASQAAADFVRRGQSVPLEIKGALDTATPAGVGRVVSDSLLKAPGNAYSKALRVFRTEIIRAHHVAYEEGAFRLPDVVGMKFNLSPAHRVTDICDDHATADRHGLGAGVYPRGKIPIPAHPNGRAFATPVFEDEIPQ